jgi:hypothetical protein
VDSRFRRRMSVSFSSTIWRIVSGLISKRASGSRCF